jgi:hypothetical protein
LIHCEMGRLGDVIEESYHFIGIFIVES